MSVDRNPLNVFTHNSFNEIKKNKKNIVHTKKVFYSYVFQYNGRFGWKIRGNSDSSLSIWQAQNYSNDSK